MKNKFLLLYFFLMATMLSAQPCGFVNISFSSQAQIDDFINNYGTCDAISGSVLIRGADITNLDSLINIQHIGGNLNILDNPLLADINGLGSLGSIGGGLSVLRNDVLTNINGLSSLTTIDGSLSLNDNPLLADVNGLGSLDSIGGGLSVLRNDVLTNINGLSSLTTIGGNLIILDNPLLADVNGLRNLASIGGNLSVIRNTSLATCCGLFGVLSGFVSPPIPNVGGSIVIRDNLDGCNSQTEIINTGACIDLTPIPTMSQWAMLLFGLIVVTLGVVGVWNLSAAKGLLDS